MKAFLVEEGREPVLELISRGPPVATNRISYVECHAAFARGQREARLTGPDLRAATRSLEDRWADLLVLELDALLAAEATQLVHSHALRSGDAIHLASAVALAAAQQSQVQFATWDARLWDAASGLGFPMAPTEPPG